MHEYADYIPLRVHVPHYYILGTQSPHIGSTLRPNIPYLGTWTLRVLHSEARKRKIRHDDRKDKAMQRLTHKFSCLGFRV